MKTLILGTSGSGKSTLAQTLGAQRSAPVLHLDAVHFLPGWKERPLEQEREMVTCFLDENPSWVMDGNYTKTCMARRLAEADQILVLYFGRFTCLYRVVRRWLQNRGQVRCSGLRRKAGSGIYLLGALAGPQPCLSCPAGPDRPDLPG